MGAHDLASRSWRPAGAIAALLCLAAGQPPRREALGQFGGWGASREGSPPLCFALAEPVTRAPRGAHPSLAFVSWPGGGRAQVHVHLGRATAAATLAVAGRRFALMVRGQEGWAIDARADRAIVAAARRADDAVVTGRATTGRRFRDLYPLAGAPSAIDAAALGCLPR